MAKTIIQLIKAAASKLKDSKLARLGGKEISEILEALKNSLQLETREEAIVFTGIFDKSSGGRPTDMDGLADYFECSTLDMMEYIPAIKSLLNKGLISVWNEGECNVTKQDFEVSALVINYLIDNRLPSYEEVSDIKPKFDRYDFCKKIDSYLQDRDVRLRELLRATADMEKVYSELNFVKRVKKELENLSDRVLFYEICHDFYSSYPRFGKSDINDTLEDMFDSFGEKIVERAAIIGKKSPLISGGLVEINEEGEEMFLSDLGKKILLEDAYKSFEPQLRCSSRYSFAKMVRKHFHDENKFNVENPMASLSLKRDITKMEDDNLQLSCIQKVKGIVENPEDRVLFYMACSYCPSGLSLTRELKTLFPTNLCQKQINEFKAEKHILQSLDLVETCSESSFFGEYTIMSLTDKGKELFFEEDATIFIEEADAKNLIRSDSITAKELFFSEEEQKQLSMVCDSIKEENYLQLVSRLESKGLSKGIAVLLYGAPGTGKTESVKQWAKETGRDIVHVDLSASKSMWYGESEKIVKEIFTRYRNLCKRSKIKPILLFNEADGLFSKRKDISTGRSVDQTENTIQNIILEEMEKLDGILVATTNLADNLDAAFERRFLFKIRLEKPDTKAKSLIWMSKLPSLSREDALSLAESYDFSGGEIDNIVRKSEMKEILDGTAPTIASLREFCSEEKMSLNKSRAKIGF